MTIVLIAALFMATAGGVTAESAGPAPDSELLVLVQKISVEQDQGVRVHEAERLLDIASSLGPAERAHLRDETVQAVASLLRHPNNEVKVSAAIALREFGARAASALPALRAARKAWHEEPVQRVAGVGIYSPVAGDTEIDSAISAIESALQQTR
ncbi:hypothetical protein AB4059_04065 [Lysobacter sp. 2RAF19]